MISGGNRKPLNAELGTSSTRRDRRGIIPSPSPPTATLRQCNSPVNPMSAVEIAGRDGSFPQGRPVRLLGSLPADDVVDVSAFDVVDEAGDDLEWFKVWLGDQELDVFA